MKDNKQGLFLSVEKRKHDRQAENDKKMKRQKKRLPQRELKGKRD